MVQRKSEAMAAVDRLLGSEQPSSQATVGFAYGISPATKSIDTNSIAHVRILLGSQEQRVVLSGIAALRSMLHAPRAVLDLMTKANIGLSKRVADEAMMLFAFDNNVLRTQTTEADVGKLLTKLQELDELDGHWIEEFLSEASQSQGEKCAEFFMSRVDRASESNNWELRPCNHGPYGHVPLKFRKSPDFPRIFSKVVNWLYQNSGKGLLFHTRSAELFITMITPFDAEFVQVLKQLSATATETELDAIGRILGEAPSWVVWTERDFVLQFLPRCRQFGDECYRRASSHLLGAAISGMRSGVPGEPFERDLKMRDAAREALQEIPRFAPGYDLYEDLLKFAETEIRQQEKEGEYLDDE